MEDMSLDTYYTVDEVADVILKVSRRTVLELHRKGDLRAVKVGRELRIPESSLKEYLGEKAP
jgi:putative molybdopterin biosynthesis protein